MIDGRRQKIGRLRTGDKFTAFDGTNLTTDEMILMLDQSAFGEAVFYTFQTKSNHMISLTGQHLIPVQSSTGTIIYIPAEQVEVGRDSLYVLSDDGIVIVSPVIQISIETKMGYFAPLTMSGTILINNVVASCFSHIHSHSLGQLVMAPIRWYYKISRYLPFMETFSSEQQLRNSDGIHWVPEIMMTFAQKFCPCILYSSSTNIL
ncbi:unnamed protein product [Rotaria socialis]|uniref:Hedgehog protein Hint domain-containing protein n=1 Tax=Rotaria socialis TaxID=392032 RepID=A0A817XX35_9BILA|nr:unnamed protein product [Rotaria socialis]